MLSGWDDSPPAGIPPLAAWLAENGLTQLQWEDDEPSAPVPVEREHALRWADGTAHAVAVARWTADRAAPGAKDSAYLYALLHQADSWLRTCADGGADEAPVGPACRAGPEAGDACRVSAAGPARQTGPTRRTPQQAVPASRAGPAADATREPAEESLGPGLPVWLQGILRGDVPLDPALAAAARALRELATVTAATGGPDALASHQDYASEVRQRWLTPAGPASRLLPVLMRRLSRCEQLETQFQATLEREKLEALRAFAYGASHEINNPLANISTRAQTLLREETDPERRRKLAVINSQAFRAHELIADLMLFARPPEMQRQRVNLTALVDQLITELAPDAAEQNTVVVRTSPAEPVWIEADGGYLAAAVTAVCRNSLEALRSRRPRRAVRRLAAAEPRRAPRRSGLKSGSATRAPGSLRKCGGTCSIRTSRAAKPDGGLGSGSRNAGAWSTQHGGQVAIDSPPGGGVTVAIKLPAHPAA